MIPVRSCLGGAHLAEEKFDQMEWKESGHEESRHTDGVRHIPDRVGSVMQWHTDRGPWSMKEKGYHINCMELLAATLVVKSFLKDQVNKRVLC